MMRMPPEPPWQSLLRKPPGAVPRYCCDCGKPVDWAVKGSPGIRCVRCLNEMLSVVRIQLSLDGHRKPKKRSRVRYVEVAE